MSRMRVSLLFLVTAFFFFFFYSSAAGNEKQLPSAMIVGTVYCDTCLHQRFSKTSHFISGASVEVECGDSRQRTSFHEQVTTNKHGEFKVHLPVKVGKHIRRIKKCSVKLVSSSEPFCSVASMATSSLLHLKSKQQGTHIFSAGFFTFKPQQQPELCYEKPSPETSSLGSMKTFLPYPHIPFPPLNRNSPPMLNLPHFPRLPRFRPLPTLPSLPPLPNLGGLQKKPGETTPTEPEEAEFLYSAPSGFGITSPPNDPLQALPPAVNLPPLPIIYPPPLPLVPPLPFSPFPFQPPDFPGIPPASLSKERSP